MTPCDSRCLTPARDLEGCWQGPHCPELPANHSFAYSLFASFFSLPDLSTSCFCRNYFFLREKKNAANNASHNRIFLFSNGLSAFDLRPPCPTWGCRHSWMPHHRVAWDSALTHCKQSPRTLSLQSSTENEAAGSANTQKTDPAMEPKLRVVDWDKVTSTGGVGMIIGDSRGQGEGV